MTFPTGRQLSLKLTAVLMTAALVAAACGGDDDSTDTSTAGSETPAPATEAPAPAPEPAEESPAPATEAPAPEPAEEMTEPESESAMGPDGLPAIGTPERCEANRDAGTLTFMTGFDYAAAAGIIEIVAASAQGYFDEMCLDVELQPGFAPGNSTALAAGATQLSVAASFGELVRLNVNGGTDMIAFSQLGHTAVSGLVVPAGTIGSLSDLAGKTVGIKGGPPGRHRGHAGLRGNPARRHHRAAARRLQPGGAPGPGHRRPAGLQVQRARRARPRRHRIRPLRPARLRRPGLVRGGRQHPRLLREAPDGGGGLRAGPAQGLLLRGRQPRGGGGQRPSS